MPKSKNASKEKEEEQKKNAKGLNSGPTHSRDLFVPKSVGLDEFPGMRL